ncbi:MAG: competence protein ComEA [Halieaceae bacterium]|jgi:competence protein ComEA
MTYTYLEQLAHYFSHGVTGRAVRPSLGRVLALTLSLGLCSGYFVMAPSAFAQETASATQVASININQADAATLAANLKGVGMSRAEEIVRHREAYGPFAAVDELEEVKGIGKSTVDKNRALISLD